MSRIFVPESHLWGSTDTVDFKSGVPSTGQSQQLVRIAYDRPETWRFLFVAEVVNSAAQAGGAVSVTVNFFVQTGVGRASSNLGQSTIGRPFAALTPALFAAGGPAGTEWTSVAYSTPLDPANTVQNVPVDLIIGQNIQVGAQVTLPVTAVLPISVLVAAYFTPNVNVRNAWFPEQDSQEHRQGVQDGTQPPPVVGPDVPPLHGPPVPQAPSAVMGNGDEQPAPRRKRRRVMPPMMMTMGPFGPVWVPFNPQMMAPPMMPFGPQQFGPPPWQPPPLRGPQNGADWPFNDDENG